MNKTDKNNNAKLAKASKVTNEDVGIKSRSIAFTLKSEERLPITEWLKEVQKFFGIRTAITNSLMSLYQNNEAENEILTKLDNVEMDIPQPIYFSYLDYQDNQIFDDMIEGLTVKFAVHLIANLSHYSENIRVQATNYIIELTSIFDSNLLSSNKKVLENCILNIQINDDVFKVISKLFQVIGPSLNRISLALVSGLECFYTYIDPLVRGICISALTQIINSNEKAFNILSKLYTKDLKLTLNIIQELMKLEKKSHIYDTIKDDKSKYDSICSSVYESFKNIIVANNEDFLDLLSWSIEEFTKICNPNKKVKESPSLTNFVNSLSYQFNAVQPLVRYGAAVCLYSTLNVFPRLLPLNPDLLVIIVNGLVDNDCYCSSLYKHIFQTHTKLYPNITKLVEEYKVLESSKLNYDYDIEDDEKNYETDRLDNDNYIEKLLKAGISIAPNISKNQIIKYANILEFVSMKECMKFLSLIKYWGQKEKKVDIYVIQALISLLTNGKEEVQEKSLEVILALIPLFNNTNEKELLFIWSHLRNILKDHQDKEKMILTLINALMDFPLQRLPDESLIDLLKIQFTLIFHKNVSIRAAVYEFLNFSYDIWKSQDLKFNVISILYAAIGDFNRENAIKICDSIIKLSYNTVLQELVPNVKEIKDTLEKKLLEDLIKAYDNLANAIHINQNNCKNITNILFDDYFTDKFWDFFLENCSDDQLVKPDEYNYSKFFIQTPFFISLLYSKFSVPPPALNDVSNNTPRDVMPTSIIGKRRFILGYIICNFPLTGISDKFLRRMACLTLIRCCFRQIVLKHKILLRLMEFIKEKMLVSKFWTYKLSGLDIIRQLIIIKLPLISQCMMAQFLDYSLDCLQNSPIDQLKQGALLFIETSILIFPKAIGPRLQDIRDSIRLMFVDDNPRTTELASRVYNLIFSYCPESQMDDFYKYLITEIDLINKKGVEAMSDPLISNLSKEESERIVIYSISALGCIPNKLLSGPIIRELLKYITSDNYKIRSEALKSIFMQVERLSSAERLTILWIVLPLLADENFTVRKTFNIYLKNVQFSVELLQNIILPHKEDSPSLTSKTYESVLAEAETLVLSQKDISEIGNDIDKIYEKPIMRQLIAEQECEESLSIPPISMDYMPYIKAAAKKICGKVSNQKIGEIIYFLLSFLHTKPLKYASYLVLSEFCCYHDESISQISKVLSDLLYQEVCMENRKTMEAAIISLYNLSEYSPIAFKQIINTITSSNEKCDGEIFAIYNLMNLIKENLPSIAPELINSYLPLVINKRQPIQKRINALFVCAELSTVCSDTESATVMKAIITFINSFQSSREKMKIFSSFESILNYFKLNNEIRLLLIENARDNLMNYDEEIRDNSISIFKSFYKSLNESDLLWFTFHYLADPVDTISEKGKMILADEELYRKYNIYSVTYIDEKVKNSNKFFDIIKNEDDTNDDECPVIAPFANEDEYNYNYYNSDARKALTQKYGLPESLFIYKCRKLTKSPLDNFDKKTFSKSENENGTIKNKNIEELNNLNSISVLHHLMKQFPSISSNVINELFENIDKIINYSSTDTFNKNEISFCFSLLENLLCAIDGINNDLTNEYMKKLQVLINALLKKADDLRKHLFTKIEKSLYFFNDYIDVPIISSEQFNLIEEIKKESQEATLEILKTGKATKLNHFENTKNEFDSILENESEELRKSVTISMFALAIYGSYYTFSNDCNMNNLILGYRFLYNILKNEHRGVRNLVTNMLVSITKNHYKVKDEFMHETMVTIKNLIKILEKDDDVLYYRKIDILNLICNLSCIINDKSIEHDTIKILLNHWRDLNDETRIVSINLIKFMGECGVTEIINGLSTDKNDKSENSINIMVEIASLMSNPEYTEKAELNELLNWYFEKIKEIKITKTESKSKNLNQT
ncbi:hypothetical protein LY90DRAFT_704931 [Neocallimastix californiae]|uniref:ARM repeat-containing protein n=1 Tax=Neocallimastix californiae TaxID=1754190 RepID=A0A1Y2BK05_9FUNG|nr:hypothetical protein LY90DRAFT_704931 [Neocallimastix californiae]|eukprot:ORY35099.1 hypothetical protein LY90DRAFT_704931 [Neocallimastix californiae]